MTDTVIRNASAILTGRPGLQERATGDIHIRAGRIVALGRIERIPHERTIDATDCVVYPGSISTHHHFAQSVLKGVPAGLSRPLEDWAREVLFRYWYRIDTAALEIAATIAVVELLLGGTTTAVDHHLMYGEDDTTEAADVLFAVAERLGLRLVLARGGATLAAEVCGAHLRPLPSESLDTMLRRVSELTERYHDPAPDAMRRVAFAPNLPFGSIAPHELREIAVAARSLGIMLHTHLSETAASVAFCEERYGERPVPWLARHGWSGRDVWFAHAVHVDSSEADELARAGTGIALCSQSNARLGAGTAAAVRFDARGVSVSLGVDGAASNEAADMPSEVHAAWLAQRAVSGAAALRPEDVVRWSTAGGADVLGLSALGTISPGQIADLAIFSLDHPRYAGLHDPAVGPIICGSAGARTVLASGRIVVGNGAVVGVDLARLSAAAGVVVRTLIAS